MKKWLVATALIATTISGVTQAKEWKTVRFGIEGAYPPFSWTEADGSLKGFDVDMPMRCVRRCKWSAKSCHRIGMALFLHC